MFLLRNIMPPCHTPTFLTTTNRYRMKIILDDLEIKELVVNQVYKALSDSYDVDSIQFDVDPLTGQCTCHLNLLKLPIADEEK